MKKIYKICLLTMALATVVTGCTGDFLNVNENPNDPTVSTPDLTLPSAEQTFARLNATSMTELGNYIMYNWSVPSNWQAQGDLFRYNVTTTFYSTIFETSYGTIFKNLTYVKNYEDPTGQVEYSAYDDIANIIEGFQYQYLVDLYGDVPFTEANQRTANLTPKYDDAETIYKAVIDTLTNAASSALNLPDNAQDPGSQDIIFGGNMSQWAQFANTIKLRMLVRLSNTGQDSYIKEQIASIDANGAGYITGDVVANPNYSNNDDKQNPYYSYYGFQTSGTRQDRNNFTVATDYTINYLQNTNDPRLERLYAPSQNADEFKGAEQNINQPGEGFTTKDLSQIGPGLLKSSAQDQPIMLLSEALFLQSEAVLRGYISGDAKDLYQQAIAASFQYLGVDDTANPVDEYYAQDINNVSWDASSNKYEAIITQKWIALNGTSSIETWIEYTRTGFPANLPTSKSAVESRRPVTLLYPSSEYSRNQNNVPARTPADAFTKTPFWK
jgi:hypothetical protein